MSCTGRLTKGGKSMSLKKFFLFKLKKKIDIFTYSTCIINTSRLECIGKKKRKCNKCSGTINYDHVRDVGLLLSSGKGERNTLFQ